MKLAITQIIMGVLIVCAAGYVLWWMLFGIVELLAEKVPDASGVMVQDYTPENEILFTAARYASGILLALGLLVVVTGALWKKVENKKELAVTQIIASTLIVAVSIFILFWGYSFDFIVAIKGGPVLDMGQARALTLFTGVLGMASFSVGVIQLGKSRKPHTVLLKESHGT